MTTPEAIYGARIDSIEPSCAIVGGEITVRGSGLMPSGRRLPEVAFGGVAGHIISASDEQIIARIPEGGSSPISVRGLSRAESLPMRIADCLCDELHPVANPVVDREGNIYATVSGARGQSVPISVFKITTSGVVLPYAMEILNATGLAFDGSGCLYVSSRHTGVVYRVINEERIESYAKGLGVATGIAFDNDGNLYVGDRNGAIFKITRERAVFVFATLPKSVAAYHLAFGPDERLYVCAPTLSSRDEIYAIDEHGHVDTFCGGLGRPQGLAFDRDGNLYVVASLGGRRGVVRITPRREMQLVIAGDDLVGLAFLPSNAIALATSSSVHRLNFGVEGLPLHGQLL